MISCCKNLPLTTQLKFVVLLYWLVCGIYFEMNILKAQGATELPSNLIRNVDNPGLIYNPETIQG